MKRTPRSASRCALQLLAKDRHGLRSVEVRACLGSLERFISSGTWFACGRPSRIGLAVEISGSRRDALGEVELVAESIKERWSLRIRLWGCSGRAQGRLYCENERLGISENRCATDGSRWVGFGSPTEVRTTKPGRFSVSAPSP